MAAMREDIAAVLGKSRGFRGLPGRLPAIFGESRDLRGFPAERPKTALRCRKLLLATASHQPSPQTHPVDENGRYATGHSGHTWRILGPNNFQDPEPKTGRHKPSRAAACAYIRISTVFRALSCSPRWSGSKTTAGINRHSSRARTSAASGPAGAPPSRTTWIPMMRCPML
jgi:hypothetical protein